MPISDHFKPRDFVRPVMEFHIRFDKSDDKIKSGKFWADICNEDGDDILRRDLPLDVFNVTAQQRNLLEAFFGGLVQQLLDDTGKEILP